MKQNTDKKENIFISFLKRETVLVAASILAIISAFFVTPNKKYMSYIDWRVLGILLSLMTVMAGLQKNGLFDKIGKKLLTKTKNTAQLTGVLVFLCFFSSMIITNDVALITFVPFTVLTLRKCKQERLMVLVIVLQTIAANMGSMLTPIGNPQNLYLYNVADMTIGEFILCTLPYTVVSGLLLVMIIFVLSARKRKISLEECSFAEDERYDMKRIICYLLLFALCILSVARLVPYYLILAVILVTVLIIDRSVFGNVDYCLLLTFIAFFIFTGNIGNLPQFRDFLKNIVTGRELVSGVITSQVISNVPATLMLSEFTTNYRTLLKGVNIGGLGTLIASMASLISYKIYAHNYNRTKWKYLFWFTVGNFIFLAVLMIVALAIKIHT